MKLSALDQEPVTNGNIAVDALLKAVIFDMMTKIPFYEENFRGI